MIDFPMISRKQAISYGVGWGVCECLQRVILDSGSGILSSLAREGTQG